jgi:hypothetical protein
VMNFDESAVSDHYERVILQFFASPPLQVTFHHVFND